ncbi:MAG: hypothetical protein QM621_08995 [Aeromicrobium sp.]|uniref:hypothetical protein n=1 Tax=Aeromicrobium sp. TaxID=1871063 RepID=UPI0039E6E172
MSARPRVTALCCECGQTRTVAARYTGCRKLGDYPPRCLGVLDVKCDQCRKVTWHAKLDSLSDGRDHAEARNERETRAHREAWHRVAAVANIEPVGYDSPHALVFIEQSRLDKTWTVQPNDAHLLDHQTEALDIAYEIVTRGAHGGQPIKWATNKAGRHVTISYRTDSRQAAQLDELARLGLLRDPAWSAA